MTFSEEILEELKSISPVLAEIGNENIFSVPEGYFEVLSIELLKKLNNPDSQPVKLSVPEGYFENLSAAVLNKIKSLEVDNPAKELRTLSPMLYSIQNENVFEVPKNYFKNLEDDILQKVITKPQAKVVAMKKRDSIWKYAAAAVVTGVIIVSSLMFFNSGNQSLQNTSTRTSVTSSIKTASQFTSEQQVKAAIATLSDEEIIKYLEKTTTDLDSEILSTSIDANELPAPNEYLLDENTLDSYLNETSKNAQN